MKKISSTFLATVFLLSACASHHSGTVAESPSSPEGKTVDMVISAEKISELSDENHTMLVFTFENTTRDWARFKTAQFSCGNECDNETNIILGSDLSAWTKSQYIKKTVKEHNKSLVYAGILVLGVAGAIAGANNGSQGQMNTGLGIYGAGAGAIAYDSIKSSRLNTKISSVDGYSDHVYNSFSVPAGGYAKKWILVNTPKRSEISKIHLTFETIEGELRDYDVNF